MMRYQWVDSLKGLAMVMVVLGHCGESEYFFKGLYYIHLPIFILASGFWLGNVNNYSNWENLRQRISRKFKQLMFPYIGFGLMSIVLQYVLYFSLSIPIQISSLLKNILMLENYANWFLPLS